MTDKTFKDYLKEDSIDMEKHNTLNDIFQALERLNTEIDELDALDSDMDSTGVGDLNDQLTTFRKHISALYQVLDRAGRIVPMESVNEAVDQALIDSVVDQIMRDIEMGDQTAIEELLMSCPEANLRSFLSNIEESAELNELNKLKKLAGLGNNVYDPGKGHQGPGGYVDRDTRALQGDNQTPIDFDKIGKPKYPDLPTLELPFDPKDPRLQDPLDPKDVPDLKYRLPIDPLDPKDVPDPSLKMPKSYLDSLRRRAGIK